MSVHAYAAHAPSGKLEHFEYDLGILGSEDVDIKVEHCGICHSDLSMLGNDWEMTEFPFVPGHEVVGTVEHVGSEVKNLKPGQKVGLGWYSRSCMTCSQCMSGDHNLCSSSEGTIVKRHGGFANVVRAQSTWVIPLPESLNAKKAGPLFCAGVTVFSPIVEMGVKPTDKVGVIGIGGLGHLALGFLNAWGCEVTAFSSNPEKTEEAKNLGAHNVVNSTDASQLESIAGSLDFIISTVNVSLPWDAYLQTLRPKGRLHTVGAVLEPFPIQAFSLIAGQKSVSGSPLGSPETTKKMLEFASRHNIAPVTQHYPMSQVNEALEELKAGKARYRIVLDADF